MSAKGIKQKTQINQVPKKSLNLTNYDLFTVERNIIKNNMIYRTKNKKWDGLSKYVWRMIRFHIGADMHMPVTADFDLADYYKEKTGKKFSYVGKEYTAIKKEVHLKIIQPLLDKYYPKKQYTATARYKGLLY
jgi:hypothetical protein